jgi:hypothetical protein
MMTNEFKQTFFEKKFIQKIDHSKPLKKILILKWMTNYSETIPFRKESSKKVHYFDWAFDKF